MVGQKVVILNLQTGNYSDFVSFNVVIPVLDLLALPLMKMRMLYCKHWKGLKTTLPNNGIPLSKPVPWYYPNTGVTWKITVLW
jgi:hypothetical protein